MPYITSLSKGIGQTKFHKGVLQNKETPKTLPLTALLVTNCIGTRRPSFSFASTERHCTCSLTYTALLRSSDCYCTTDGDNHFFSYTSGWYPRSVIPMGVTHLSQFMWILAVMSRTVGSLELQRFFTTPFAETSASVLQNTCMSRVWLTPSTFVCGTSHATQRQTRREGQRETPTKVIENVFRQYNQI